MRHKRLIKQLSGGLIGGLYSQDVWVYIRVTLTDEIFPLGKILSLKSIFFSCPVLPMRFSVCQIRDQVPNALKKAPRPF